MFISTRIAVASHTGGLHQQGRALGAGDRDAENHVHSLCGVGLAQAGLPFLGGAQELVYESAALALRLQFLKYNHTHS